MPACYREGMPNHGKSGRAVAAEGAPAEADAAPGRCERCGSFTELRLGDRTICESCCDVVGSCCTESEMD
jgi:hypothetical protein